MFSIERNIRLTPFKILIASALAISIFVLFIQLPFLFSWSELIFEKNTLNALPKNSVGLILGTTSQTTDGQKNVFFETRMQATKELYEAGKIDCVLLSGDNSSAAYNEPLQMQKALLALWIPAERMYLDYAWLRTRDSILRARDIFGITEFTIVSQRFHLQRALYHAISEDMSVVGYAAKSPSFLQAPKVYIREFLSRFVAFYDKIVGTESKFSGSKIPIEYNENVRPVPSKICSPR